MADIQVRGYSISAAMKYMQEVGGADGERALQSLSEGAKQTLHAITPADWYSVGVLGEMYRAMVAFMAKNDQARAEDVLTTCGKYMGREATNTFLRLLMKMLTPAMLAKKFPDLWRRDFSGGRAEIKVDEKGLVCRYYDVPGFDHASVVGSGFVIFTLEAMGKSVEKVTRLDWSLDRPNVDGAGFELLWKV